ncbi:MAG TPA: lactate utilization protein C [Gaiellaceae bacterium]
MSEAREEILERIRAAVADVPEGHTVDVPRAYRRSHGLGREETVALFCERVGDYRASVVRSSVGDLPRTLGEICAAQGASTLVAPADLSWRPEGVELVAADDLEPDELDRSEGVLTGCALAIAETGTIVLDSGPAQGRRALTLVPDFHVCVVEADRIVESVPEATAEMGAIVRETGRPVTLVSGPSATSDIELSRVEGVHGPRTLAVVVVEG